MTTKLAGQRTRFLPFNRGYDGGAGNPPNPTGHRTSLPVGAGLAARRLARPARPLRPRRDAGGGVEGGEAQRRRGRSSRASTSGTRCCKLEADARARGAGQNYLVQHSAGSGKSNTIAWLAHRLSTLHDAADEKVFDKVVVITDRVVLDRQLQETIYQFEHAHGVVVKIDQDSAQLAEALAGEQARIIITTLQKFPFVLDKVGELPAAPLRGDRGRGALLPDRRGREGPEGSRSARRRAED